MNAESLPTDFDIPEYEYSREFLLEHLVLSNPKKVPSSHTDSGVGKSVTRTQTKKSEFSEVCIYSNSGNSTVFGIKLWDYRNGKTLILVLLAHSACTNCMI